MEIFTRLVTFLGKSLGLGMEVVLFDAIQPHWEILASNNLKESTINIIKDLAKAKYENEKCRNRGYFTNSSENISIMKISKMSAFYIENDQHELIGVLALSMRCDELLRVQTLISSLLTMDDDDDKEETMSFPVVERSLNGISQYIKDFGIVNQTSTYNERFEIICDLYDMDLFSIKGSVAKTAEELGISDKSVYRYITKIKEFRE